VTRVRAISISRFSEITIFSFAHPISPQQSGLVISTLLYELENRICLINTDTSSIQQELERSEGKENSVFKPVFDFTFDRFDAQRDAME